MSASHKLALRNAEAHCLHQMNMRRGAKLIIPLDADLYRPTGGEFGVLALSKNSVSNSPTLEEWATWLT